MSKCACCGRFLSLNSTLVVCKLCGRSSHQACANKTNVTDTGTSSWQCYTCSRMATAADVKSIHEALSSINKKLEKLSSNESQTNKRLEKIQNNTTETQKKVSELQESVQHMSDKYDEILGEIEKLQIDNNQIKTSYEGQAAEIAELKQQLNQVEQHARNKHIEIHNYPYHKDTEDVDKIVADVTAALNITFEKNTLLNSHRNGNKVKADGTPPVIIAEFSSTRISTQFLYNKKKKNLTLKVISPNMNEPDRKIYVSPNLTKLNRHLYIQTKRTCMAKNQGIFWTTKGAVKYKKDDRSKIVHIN